MHPDEVREKFLRDNAEFLLDEQKKVLRGEGEFTCPSGIHLSRAFKLIDKIILTASDRQKLEMETTREVVLAVGKGKISADEGAKLLEILKTQQDIEELPKLIAAVEALKEK